MRNLPAGGDFLGSPAEPVQTALRQFAMVRRLAKAGGRGADARRGGRDDAGDGVKAD